MTNQVQQAYEQSERTRLTIQYVNFPTKTNLRKMLKGRKCYIMPVGLEFWINVAQSEIIEMFDFADGGIYVDIYNNDDEAYISVD